MTDSNMKQTLELATAAHLPDDAAIDAETAELREAWLALGALLAPPTENIDPTQIFARIDATHRDNFKVTSRRSRGVVPHGRWLAVAAAVLVATGVVATMRRPQPPTTPHVSMGSPDVATTHPTWDDPLDEELVAAQQTLAQLQTGWRSPATDADNLDQQINDLISDWESETL